MKEIVEKMMFRLLIRIIWGLFIVMKRLDPSFKKALFSFKAVFLFRCGISERHLKFDNGWIQIGNLTDPSDFELTINDLSGAIKTVRESQGDVLMLLLKNKIHKKGNLYYLFKLGYLFSLCDRYFRNLLPEGRVGGNNTATL